MCGHSGRKRGCDSRCAVFEIWIAGALLLMREHEIVGQLVVSQRQGAVLVSVPATPPAPPFAVRSAGRLCRKIRGLWLVASEEGGSARVRSHAVRSEQQQRQRARHERDEGAAAARRRDEARVEQWGLHAFPALSSLCARVRLSRAPPSPAAADCLDYLPLSLSLSPACAPHLPCLSSTSTSLTMASESSRYERARAASIVASRADSLALALVLEQQRQQQRRAAQEHAVHAHRRRGHLGLVLWHSPLQG